MVEVKIADALVPIADRGGSGGTRANRADSYGILGMSWTCIFPHFTLLLLLNIIELQPYV